MALLGYALGYIHYVLGSKARGQLLFEAVRDGAGEEGDLRIKALMMLARLATDEGDCIRAIHSIRVPARDPQLAKLLEVWKCIVMRYQGRPADSIVALRALMASLDCNAEWYCWLAAKDALVRGQLKMMDFAAARTEIEGFGVNAVWGKFRTVLMHSEQLNGVYRDHLAGRTIVGVEKKGTLELSHGGQSVRVNQPGLRRLIDLFAEAPTLTVRKASKSLAVSPEQLREMVKRFTLKLGQMRLPVDSLDFQGIRVQLVPALRVGPVGGFEKWE